MRTARLFTAALAILGSGAHADGDYVYALGQVTRITATGTAQALVHLVADAQLVTLDQNYFSLNDPSIDWTFVHGPGASHDDLHVSSTADAVAVVIEQVGTSNPLRLAFVSHAIRAGGCQLPDCGRFEYDLRRLSGPPPDMPEGGSGPRVYQLPEGDYVVAVIAPVGEATQATIEIEFEEGAEPTPEVSVELTASSRGAFVGWEEEALRARPTGGSLSARLPEPGFGVAHLSRFHRYGEKSDPETPFMELRFNDDAFATAGGTRSMNEFRRLTMYRQLQPGGMDTEWRINTADLDRRAVSWLLLWW